MKGTERDKYLCKQVGEEYIDRKFQSIEDAIADFRENLERQAWDEWSGFGILFEWAREQDWWLEFLEDCNGIVMYERDKRGGKDPQPFCYINIAVIETPADFADAIFDFLKKREEEEAETSEKEDISDEADPTVDKSQVMICMYQHLAKCDKNCPHAEPHYSCDDCASSYCKMVQMPASCIKSYRPVKEEVWST